MSTRIVIADDHPIFRDGLKRLLESEREFKVVGEACDGVEAVKLARQLKPEILLLDLAMPRRPGLEALREMNSDSSSVRVILLTAAVEKDQIVEALQLGARGVVLKDSATQILLKSIRAVMNGEYWVGRESVSNLVQYLRTLVTPPSAFPQRNKYRLTPRELEIIAAVVAGFAGPAVLHQPQHRRRRGGPHRRLHLRGGRRPVPPGHRPAVGAAPGPAA